MKRILLCLIAIIAMANTMAFAQQGKPAKSCATMDVLERQMKENPGLERRMEAIERHTQKVVANAAKGKPTQPTDPTTPSPEPAPTGIIVRIPVVFHVVYNTADQNVSDAMINEQLRVLNEDFRKQNADISKLPSMFGSLDADTEIEFTLGGITRTATSVASFSSNDAVKYTSQGGRDAWDASKYLNFWVCNLGGGLLGYAQFPGGSAATDGVVCLYSSLPGGTAGNYNLGRTATHEIGHWMNLRHIWGDRRCGNDYVDDTPTQQTSNGGCPSFPKPTCNNTSDMFMNYMDYTYDACMYMFTYGQKERMRAVFTAGGPRATFTGSRSGIFADASTTAAATAAFETAKSASNTLVVYPNPANSEATIAITVADNASAVALQVTDMSGRVVHSELWTDAKGTFDYSLKLDKMTRGIYFVSVQSGTSKEVTKLSVVR
ncbi:M43 family zinc metalloprotease [Pontibacter sp. MBLB2868]|uniref:M43 family zinc metalloprotease n=1 Tax=Pontibacter sp. MBLB2868 TaxID=3451555 RepID=UPI003F7513BB